MFKLWTVTAEINRSGGNRKLVVITTAHDETSARTAFQMVFGSDFSLTAQVSAGISECQIVKEIFSKTVLSNLVNEGKKREVSLSASFDLSPPPQNI